MSLPNPPTAPLAVLRHRDFRLLWCGQVLSMVGSRMQGAALIWHLYLLTSSPYALGAIGLARVVPLVCFSLLGGVVADALDRRRLMLVSQGVLALLAAALGTWSLLGLEDVWPIYVVAGLSAGAGAFDGPARQSMIPALVPREELRQALSLNSISSQLASVAGPTLMGLIVARYSIGLIYWINALSFLGVITALIQMRPMEVPQADRPKVSLGAAIEGLQFVSRSRLLLSMMLLDFLATFFSSATVLLPVYAKDILHVGSLGYGWLSSAPSVGALAAAAGMALVPTIRRQGAVVLCAVFCYGAATLAFGLSRTFLACFVSLALTGAADTVSTVLRQTIRQLVTPDALRGRMTSVNMLFVQGGPQLGELEAGLVAGWLGAPFSVISGGILCMLSVLGVAAWAPWLRRYRTETP